MGQVLRDCRAEVGSVGHWGAHTLSSGGQGRFFAYFTGRTGWRGAAVPVASAW
ncbi:hypothetical protein AQS8620_01346 [Aquimixticola soesokkakensis]|uniref:Uncharacterized protein n=1 Tax=Aquimixticola soesokkakensis TaxID=1519096 RepID=A0A1Y5SCU4_9RHOB|nr:hypothetical protein AQS8620_01346 [Aquimixticola soesokkakensis]